MDQSNFFQDSVQFGCDVTLADTDYHHTEILIFKRRLQGEQCEQIWLNFATWAKLKKTLDTFERVYLIFCKILNLLKQISYAFGKILLL